MVFALDIFKFIFDNNLGINDINKNKYTIYSNMKYRKPVNRVFKLNFKDWWN